MTSIEHNQLEHNQLERSKLERNDLECGELDWLAFQYLTDELEGAERAAFEQRLADDQFAREALARAVDLTQTIVAAESIGSPMPFRRDAERKAIRWRRVAWLAATIAGCLAFALAFQLVSRQPEQTPVAKHRPADFPKMDSEQLALLWVDQLSLAVQAESTDAVAIDNEVEVLLEPAGAFGSIEEVETPDWMFAAVLGMSDKSGRDENVDMEKLNESADN